MSQYENVSVIKKANVYFDGKCISHTIQLADGTRKSIGVILPATLNFKTGAAEVMETVSGSCRYRLPGESWVTVAEGERFAVPENSNFDIEVSGEPYHYVCHFA